METSPRPWGRLLFQEKRLLNFGNIPTPVGKTNNLVVLVKDR